MLDFYAVDNETSNFTFQGSYEESQLTNFGAFVDCDEYVNYSSSLYYFISFHFIYFSLQQHSRGIGDR